MEPSLNKSELLRAVLGRMNADGLSQRNLAQRLRISQGHLSKVLRGQFARRSRVIRRLETFLGESLATQETEGNGVPDSERALLRAARDVSQGDAQVMQVLLDLMQLLSKLRRGG